ncbi:glutaredoxin-1-like [Mercenaria mercenaria]|uniref:glutaredoxin-1-like n=1 Tax=Mercenaria mercenaria TaxID=6596 RepID=UPI00234E5763|nr:glutaredoxin-1-like [Mercenaria mercenaria]
MANVKEIINDKIAKKKVMVFSKPGCPFCVMAKNVLEKYVGKGQIIEPEDYEVWEINKDPNCGQIQGELAEMTGARTVPRVFINGTCIGGGTETRALDSSKQLVEMLKKSTAQKIQQKQF